MLTKLRFEKWLKKRLKTNFPNAGKIQDARHCPISTFLLDQGCTSVSVGGDCASYKEPGTPKLGTIDVVIHEPWIRNFTVNIDRLTALPREDHRMVRIHSKGQVNAATCLKTLKIKSVLARARP